jgi:putative endonuclease
MARTYYVYMLASETRELYIGVTNDLERRLHEHRSCRDPESYSSRHRTTRLVYYGMTTNVVSAIRREKRLKRLSRQRKLRLIEQANPEWRDLACTRVSGISAPSPSLAVLGGVRVTPSLRSG